MRVKPPIDINISKGASGVTGLPAEKRNEVRERRTNSLEEGPPGSKAPLSPGRGSKQRKGTAESRGIKGGRVLLALARTRCRPARGRHEEIGRYVKKKRKSRDITFWHISLCWKRAEHHGRPT